MTKNIIAIVPAAGIGERAMITPAMQGPARDPVASEPKQYWLLKGEPMLRTAVRALLTDVRITQVRVAVSAHDTWAAHALHGLPRTVRRTCGGPTRADTVIAALEDANLGDDDWVLVHDAARPGLPTDALTRLIDTCLEQRMGAVLAQRVADTVKQSRQWERTDAPFDMVQDTVPRDRLWLAQTPQMFPAGVLRDALYDARAAGVDITDEASAFEWAGKPVLLVPGSARNFKVTWPEDFGLMEKWL